MQAVRQHVTVQPDGLIHIRVPELTPGTVAEVIILESGEIPPKSTMASLIGKGRGAFASPEAVDTFIRRERDSWE